MKKARILLVLLVAASLPLLAERVDSKTARKVATTFLNNNGAKTNQLTDLSSAAGFPNLYIFNANEGFVVMAADDCVRPILGYSLTGSFKVEDMPENVRGWLQGYNDEIQHAIDNQAKSSIEWAQQWRDLIEGNATAMKTTAVVAPLIQTQWGVNAPFNSLCPPGTAVGCVATAMAQVMKYWNYPSHGIGSHAYIPENNPSLGEQFADFNSTYYDWDNMTDTYDNSSNDVEKQAVATLMYHCGVSVEMQYGQPSVSFPSDVAYSLPLYFGYSSDAQFYLRSNYSTDDWMNMLKSDLNNNWPVQYAGNGGDDGHSFICDGYDSDNYFHFNWGFGGRFDGYYSIDSLYLTPNGAGYNEIQRAVFGIHPAECMANEPTNLSYTQNGRVISFNWTPANGAISYNIYRNNNYIGTTATPSYTETAPFGNNVYFVRSVDSNENQSLSSNAVSFSIEYPQPVVNDLTANLSGNVVSLHWTAPEWCFPQTETSILTYGSGTPESYLGYSGSANMYWGHRFLPSDLTEASDKVIFSVSFYVKEPGNYELNIYKGTTTLYYDPDESYDIPVTLLANKAISATQTGWFTIDLDDPVAIDDTQDLWVLMYDPESKKGPAEYCMFNEHGRGGYFSTDISSWTYTQGGYAFLIRTYLTDGTYTYNLYQDGVKIAENLNETTHSVTLNDNATNLFAVKTNYYGGETDNSNKIGFAKGTASTGSFEMSANDRMTLVENSVLTITDTLSNDDPNNLVIEDGAQLIHHSDGVKATFKKNITGYAGNSGWYTIAAPFTVFDPSTIASDNYDLYAFDEDAELGWVNFKAHLTDFPSSPYNGFLYAHNPGTTLRISGTLPNGDLSHTVNLGFGNTHDAIKGFNLLGNHTAHDITFNKSDSVADGYYYLDNSEAWIYEPGNTVPAGRGFLIKAEAEGQTVTLNANAKHGNDAHGIIRIDVDGEQAYVKLDQGVSMPLLDFRGQHSGLYLARDGKDYIMLANDKNENIDLRYQPRHEGQHQLHVTVENAKLEYLHLIDLLNGNDIDLLLYPDYTFESSSSDHNTRFQLVFDEPNPQNDIIK